MTKTKDKLVYTLQEAVDIVRTNRASIFEIKENLEPYGITGGRIEKILIDPSILKSDDTDMRELALVSEQFYLISSLQSLEPSKWFSEPELKEAKQYYALDITEDESKFPFVINDVSFGGNNVFSTMLDIKTIVEWMEMDDLFYNFDIQRQAKKKIREGSVIKTPTVYQKNVKEIEELLLKGELTLTTLAFNAATQTSDSGEELTYDSKNKTLTINKGTRLDILDGFHRCLGSRAAFLKNPSINFKFNVLISNYTTPEAQQYQYQHGKGTPIPKSRIESLEVNRLSNRVVKQLQSESELRGRVSQDHLVRKAVNELVSHRVLENAIDREFKMKSIAETYGITDYLSTFFNYLIGMNEEFSNNSESQESLKSYNRMFAGYVALAAKMKELEVEPQKLNKVLEQVDFSKSNPLWIEFGILNENLNISDKGNDVKIAKYFRTLKI